MKPFILLVVIFSASLVSRAQKIDSIYFNLYTDSLKKQVHNYINIDGKFSNGTWLPLTDKDISFSSSTGKFDGNSLILDSVCAEKKVTIKAVLKSNPAIWREVTVYIKTTADNERLKTMDEVLQPSSPRKKKSLNE
ncbi:MAG: hypothetical protein H7122_04330 [Chitinophagaceae bacterium]|nr:hypothetical protein [Chitinophagaceae bacterium]